MSTRTPSVSDSVRGTESQLMAFAHFSSVVDTDGRCTKRFCHGLRTSPPRRGTRGSTDPTAYSVGTGRTGSGFAIQQCPAIGATAARRSARSAANRNAIPAPFENPATYTLLESISARFFASWITAARNATSSEADCASNGTVEPSSHRGGFVRNFGGLFRSGCNPSGKAKAKPSRSAIWDQQVSSSAHSAVAPVP